MSDMFKFFCEYRMIKKALMSHGCIVFDDCARILMPMQDVSKHEVVNAEFCIKDKVLF